MAMPEASVDEYRRMVLRQDDIRFAGKLLGVKPEPEARTMQQRTQPQFRAGISPLYPGHIPASPFARNRIYHQRSSLMESSTCATISAICFASCGGTAFPT